MNVLTLFFLKESGGNPCFVKVVISGANGYATATEYAAGSAAAATENPFLWPSGVEQNLGNGVYGYRLRKISAQTTGSTLLIPSDGVNNIDILATGGWYYSPCSLYRQSLNNACESSGTSRYPEAYIGNGGGNYKQLYFYVSSAIGSAGFDIWVKYVRVPV
jgi:hypothetical protein